ncbi:hypothetical protein BJX63DRAFT_416735 [Aspergillus granulosus]|uniref:ABM domain-containing protein n=1 Tax=Aspergillus granulosus TaxID=176169 RepID=A0ABR4GRM9_9EURO
MQVPPYILKMPVRELACLRLKNNEALTSTSNTDVLNKLRTGLQEQARYTKYATHILSQIEDPSVFYILGKWESVSQHLNEWIPSETNQIIMHRLADDLKVVWLQHLEIASPTSDGKNRDDEGGIPLAADVVAIGRYFISAGNKDAFEGTFHETKHHLKHFNGGKGICGTWRNDREVHGAGNAQEEFVLFSGWTDVEEHMKFAESEEFKEFARIKEFLKGAEIKHTTLLASEHP